MDRLTNIARLHLDPRTRVAADLLDNTYKALPVSLLAVVITSLILVITHQDVTPVTSLLTWLAIIILITSLRWMALRYYLSAQHHTDFSIAYWHIIAIVGAALSGISWGSASIFVFAEQSIPHQAFLTLIVAGMCAGAVTTLSAQIGLVFIFVSMATLPLAVRIWMSGHDLATEMTIMVVLFDAMLIPITIRYHRVLKDHLTEHYERELAEEKLEQSEELFKNIFENAPMGIGAVSLDGQMQNSNQLFCDMLGYSRDELLDMRFSDFTHPDDIADSKIKFRELLQGKIRSYRMEKRYIRKDGQTIWARTHVRGIFDDNGELEYVVGMLEDISSQVKADEEVKELIAHLQVIYDSTPDMLIMLDDKGNLVYANDRACKMLGYELGALLKLPLTQIMGQEYTFEQAMEKITQAIGGHNLEFEWVARTCEGREFDIDVRLAPLIGDNVQTRDKVLCICRDITERKQAEEALRESEELIRYRANYDELTNLPNRYNFMQQLENALALNDRRENMVGLLYLDLDRFKNVNDALGHDIGDELLTKVAQRLKKNLRVTDTVARLGGDEFTILLQDLNDDIRPIIIAENIIAELERPFHIQGHEIYTGTSIGITLAPEDGDDANTLLKHADLAMYKAKEQGRNTFHYFTRELTDKAQHYVEMEKELRRAIHQNEFVLHYQPVIDLKEERIVGVEALVRWNHPERGLVFPDEFIPVAEESHLILELGEWVLRNACSEVALWNINDLHLAINVSTNQLRGSFNREVVEGIIDQSGFRPERLNFEITESLLMEEESEVTQTLQEFRDLAIHLSVDDFGTGYSSMSYLRTFPVNILKIDRSFVRDMETDPGDAQLVATIIGMAKNLNLRVIAEGVETEHQVRILRRLGCDMVQGYYYGKPQPAEKLIPQLSD